MADKPSGTPEILQASNEVDIIRPDVVPLLRRYLVERRDELRRRGEREAVPLFPNTG